MKKCHTPGQARQKLGYPPNPGCRTTRDLTTASSRAVLRGEMVREPLPLTDGHHIEQTAPLVIAWRWQIYRVRIKSQSARHSERFAYIEAGSEQDACTRVATAAAAFECCRFSDVRERVSAKSSDECFRDGVSKDAQLRLFELSWHDGRVATWVEQPIFLLPQPSELTLKWSSVLRTLLQ